MRARLLVMSILTALAVVLVARWAGADNFDVLTGSLSTCDADSGRENLAGRPADNDLHTFFFSNLTQNVHYPAGLAKSYYGSLAEVDAQYVGRITATTDAVL